MSLLIPATRQIDADVWKVEAFSVPCSLITSHTNRFIICPNSFRFATTNWASHIIPSHEHEQEQKFASHISCRFLFFFLHLKERTCRGGTTPGYFVIFFSPSEPSGNLDASEVRLGGKEQRHSGSHQALAFH